MPSAIDTLSLHDALPIYRLDRQDRNDFAVGPKHRTRGEALLGSIGPGCHEDLATDSTRPPDAADTDRSEEHTSELQSRGHLVCRLLLEKKNKQITATYYV